jgi:hypothetical protein
MTRAMPNSGKLKFMTLSSQLAPGIQTEFENILVNHSEI